MALKSKAEFRLFIREMEFSPFIIINILPIVREPLSI